MSSKELWETNISYKTKETIWKYLQTFCLLSLNYKSNQDLQSALSDLNQEKTIEIKDKKIASDVKKIKKMAENIQEPIAEDINDSNNDTTTPNDPLSEMENLMNTSEIGKIAKEVSESLDLESMLGDPSDNPMDMLQKLMSGDAMNKIMGTIHNVVSDKVDSGSLDKDEMTNEAQDMYQTMGSNPLFQAMNQMGQSMAQNMAQPATNRNAQSNKVRTRLQNKLKEKIN